MKRLGMAATLLTSLLAGAPAQAHHSSFMYDMDKVQTLKGTVRDFQWTNPHIWIQLVVDDHGVSREWSIECQSISAVLNAGWKPRVFKVGDQVTIRFHPIRDGTTGGWFMGAILANGETLGNMGS